MTAQEFLAVCKIHMFNEVKQKSCDVKVTKHDMSFALILIIMINISGIIYSS